MESSDALRAAPPPAAQLWRPAARTAAGPTVRGADAAFALALALFIAARLWGLTKYSLWYDEIFSLIVADHGWGEMLSRVVRDVVHPPLFYATLKLWMDVGGGSVAWLRLLPALVAVASVLPLTLLCRELRLTSTQTNLALLLLALNGFLVDYAHELRMYSMLVFFTLASLALFVRLLRADGARQVRATAALCAVNVLLVYTQYFGWMIVGAEG